MFVKIENTDPSVYKEIRFLTKDGHVNFKISNKTIEFLIYNKTLKSNIDNYILNSKKKIINKIGI